MSDQEYRKIRGRDLPVYYDVTKLATTNPKRKCRYCGKPMPEENTTDFQRTSEGSTITRPDGSTYHAVGHLVPVAIRVTGYGYRGKGKFCSLRCGYKWAMRFVR